MVKHRPNQGSRRFDIGKVRHERGGRIDTKLGKLGHEFQGRLTIAAVMNGNVGSSSMQFACDRPPDALGRPCHQYRFSDHCCLPFARTAPDFNGFAASAGFYTTAAGYSPLLCILPNLSP